MARSSTRLLAGVLLWTALAASLPASAQDSPAVSPDPELAIPTVTAVRDPLAALSSVRESIRDVDSQIESLSASLARANPGERETVEAELKALNARRDSLRKDFESIAIGVDPGEYEEAPATTFVLKDEMDELLRPIINELKSLTEGPREIERLRVELGVWQRRRATASGALAHLDSLPEADEAGLADALAATRRSWEEKRTQAENRIQTLSYQFEIAEKDRPSFYETLRDGSRAFFRTRGLNFLLCIAVFFGTFFGLRYLHRHLHTRASWMRRSTRPFYVRLIDVGLDLFSFIGAIAATLFTLYATGDWVLMGVAIILLIGLALAARNGLPKFYDDAKLLLNIGEIREGERIVFDGIPWRIDSLSFFTVLKNDHLRGGRLRLPVRRLAGLHSRAVAENELWFPTEEGDWIDLPDIGHARVVSQTPEWVHLVRLGGARITFPTIDFLETGATNLAHGFRLNSTIGIDYRHLAKATSEIPATLEAHLIGELNTFLGEKGRLVSLKVEFASAGQSSLNLEIIADFDGAAASRYAQLRRSLQRFAVECCHLHRWEIPFPQIVVHGPPPPTAST
jgi:predicted  nucleic acid-binding Zn-ribbon protein